MRGPGAADRGERTVVLGPDSRLAGFMSNLSVGPHKQ
jgi:hypothetical protein